MSAPRPDRFQTVDAVLRSLALGTLTLPAALGAMWEAGMEAERIDGMLMARAQREAARVSRGRASESADGGSTVKGSAKPGRNSARGRAAGRRAGR